MTGDGAIVTTNARPRASRAPAARARAPSVRAGLIAPTRSYAGSPPGASCGPGQKKNQPRGLVRRTCAKPVYEPPPARRHRQGFAAGLLARCRLRAPSRAAAARGAVVAIGGEAETR